MHDLQARNNRVFPVLVDEQIHYRLMKLLDSVSDSAYRVNTWLIRTRPLYGVGHPDKYALTFWYRSFFPTDVVPLQSQTGAWYRCAIIPEDPLYGAYVCLYFDPFSHTEASPERQSQGLCYVPYQSGQAVKDRVNALHSFICEYLAGPGRGCDAHELSLPIPCPIRFVNPFPNAEDRVNLCRVRFSRTLVGH